MAIKKSYEEDVLWAATSSFTHAQNTKIANAAKYNQISKIIATFKFYCNKEIERRERIATPKDIGNPSKLIFDAGEDYRIGESVGKVSLWGFLNGAQ